MIDEKNKIRIKTRTILCVFLYFMIDESSWLFCHLQSD